MKTRSKTRRLTEAKETPPLLEGDVSRALGVNDLADPLSEEALLFALVGVKTMAVGFRALSAELLCEWNRVELTPSTLGETNKIKKRKTRKRRETYNESCSSHQV